jgi:pyruvoyl-dependent arginine decarboxylase (PvlArgDC)
MSKIFQVRGINKSIFLVGFLTFCMVVIHDLHTLNAQQVPQGIMHQSVIRNNNGSLVINQSVAVRISVLQGTSTGAAVFVETHQAQTNANGLLSLKVGGGLAQNGSGLGGFNQIVWGSGPYFLKTEVDPLGGINYTLIQTSELLSVPFALYSQQSLTPGPVGPQGAQGIPGNDGAVGPQGPQGIPGNDGAVGPQGPIGLTGSVGPAGNDGVTGPQGPIGLTGPAGNDGAVGPQGPQGIQGTDGAVGPEGPQGIPGNDGAVGPQGPQGIQGNDGAVGPQGPQGPIGLTGPSGPQGAQGNDGIPGPQGPQGIAGTNGTNGPSAFQVAVTSGFVGTESQWLASLVGIQGPSGPTGPQGPQGITGTNGSDATVTVGAINSTSNTNGATITTGVLNLAPADSTNGGIITTGTQTFSGNKTFSSDIKVNGITIGNGAGNEFDTELNVLGRASFRTNVTNSGLIFDGYSPSGSLGVSRIYTDAISGTPSDIVLGTYPNAHFNQLYLKQSNGFVGIKTASPTSALDVNGTATATSFVKSGGSSNEYLMADGSVTNGVPVTVGAISASSNANGAAITSGVLNLAPADATNGGIVTTGTQTFSGNKEIIGNLKLSEIIGSETLDQSSSNLTSGTGPYTSLWQSFTAGISGSLSKVTMFFYNCQASGTLYIYQGTGTNGTLLSSQSFSFSTNGANDLIENFSLVNPPSVTSGSIYTMAFIASSGTLWGGITNDYNQGISYFGNTPSSNSNNSGSLYFKTFVRQTVSPSLVVGEVTYPSMHGTTGQVLTTNGTGTLAWSTPSTGPQGPIGLTGPAGPAGNDGATGPQGPIGLTGPAGPTGPQGPQGPQGITGTNGSDATVTVGAINSISNTNGATITTGVLNLAPADSNNGGIITTGAQTFSGNKTFNSDIKVNGKVIAGASSAASSSAILEANSTSQGFLPPRMTVTQRNNISSPADGLIIFNSSTNSLNVFLLGSWHQLSMNLPQGSISSLSANSPTNNGSLVLGLEASGVSSVIPYAGGNGEAHNGQTVTSSGVTGLTATLSAGSFALGSGILTYTITGSPSSSGTASFALNIGGLTSTLTRTVDSGLIASLNASSPTNNGLLIHGVSANSVTSVVSYIGGNGGPHNGQLVSSSGVSGLTASLSAGSFASGSGTLTYTITGTPSSSGTAVFALNIGGQTATLNLTVNSGSIATLDVSSPTNTGSLWNSVNCEISYSGGDGGSHTGQTVSSTGVTGLTATISAGSFALGSGTLTYTITGTPSSSGTASFALSIGGQTATLTRTVDSGLITFLDASTPKTTGAQFNGYPVNGSSYVSYTGGNGGPHSGQTVSSTGVTGLTATLSAGSFTAGIGTLTYTLSGTPSGVGTASFLLNIGGITTTLDIAIVTLAIGQPYQGGKIAHFNGPNGFIAALSDQGSGTWQTAVSLAHGHNGGGYTDWILPNVNDLGILYYNRDILGGFIWGNHYWSSTLMQWPDRYAGWCFCWNGNYGSSWQGNNFSVRAIRFF